MSMRKMTEAQAELYIRAGYFPRFEDLDAICDLQDVYGHQNYWAILRWLYDDDTRMNAEELYRLIWNQDVVDGYIRIVDNMKEKKAYMKTLEEEIDKLTNELNSLKCTVGSDLKKMFEE